jgi:cyclomaltodextrinase
VDPSLGDTVVLKTLINELHRRNRKVVLSVPFTHTGTEFPTFVDIMKNGAHSRYLDWYLIKSTPITTTPPSYECWQDDWRFPKLNLKNPQVVNYLTGYLEYWKHFGFDGFRIGEDEKIEPTFIRTMRTHIKSKYPDCLLLGSDPYLLTGNAFDGCDQYALADVLNKYFIAKTISTSDFDRWIRRLFFFNPPQSNAINIIHSSVYGSRIAEGADTETLKNMYAFIFTCLGSPLVLNGDEIGLKYKTGLNPASFPWHSEGQNQELKREIIDLIALRKTYPQIANPHFYALYVNDITRVYAYDRGGLIVVLNSGNASSYVELPAWDGTYIDLVTSATLTAFSQKLRLSVEPMTYRILRREI